MMDALLLVTGTDHPTKEIADYTMKQLLRATEAEQFVLVSDFQEGIEEITRSFLDQIGYPYYSVAHSEIDSRYRLAELAHRGMFIAPDDYDLVDYMYDLGKEVYVVTFQRHRSILAKV